MYIEVPVVLGAASLSTLDGWALLSHGWEQETMYYLRLATVPASLVGLFAAIHLQRAYGALPTMQLGVCGLGATNLLLCAAAAHTWLLLGALVLAGSACLVLLPALRILSAQSAAAQAGTAATLLAVAHGSRAVGLALHAYVFERASARRVLYAQFALGAALEGIALLITFAVPPTAWAAQGGGWPLGTKRATE